MKILSAIMQKSLLIPKENPVKSVKDLTGVEV